MTIAIGFARAQMLQRSKGYSLIGRLAYSLRRTIVSSRSGLCYQMLEQNDVVAAQTLGPAGLVLTDEAAIALWQHMNGASKRKDAVVGIELLLSLPHELDLASNVRLVQQFVQSVLVDRHGLLTSFAIHRPHGQRASNEWNRDREPNDSFAEAVAMAALNIHAHVIISARQLRDGAPDRKRYQALDPVVRNGRTFGRNWGRLWRQFQNQFFAAEGLDIRVTPNPAVPLERVPLDQIRRWRRKLEADGVQSGRAFLVNATREEENRAVAQTFDGALAAFDEPFTRSELLAYLGRHVDDAMTLEIADALIGLEECVELSIPDAKSNWYASPDLIWSELACFGLAVDLGSRLQTSRDVERHLDNGYSSSAQQILRELFLGTDLVVVDCSGDAEMLVADVAQLAQAAGLVPVSVGHAAGHALPKSVVRSFDDLKTKATTDAVIIIDDADAVTPFELQIALKATRAARNKLVLLRRLDSDWPALPLLSLITPHCTHLAWNASGQKPMGNDRQAPLSPRSAIVERPAALKDEHNIPGWPKFALSPEGALTARSGHVANIVQFMSTMPDVLDWQEEPHLSGGLAIAERLLSSVQSSFDGEAGEGLLLDVVDDVAYGAEEEAFDALYRDVPGPLELEELDDASDEGIDATDLDDDFEFEYYFDADDDTANDTLE